MELLSRVFSAVWSSCVSYARRNRYLLIIACILAVFSIGSYQYLCTAPNTFSSGTIVSIPYGTSVEVVSRKLSETHIIKYPALLRALLRLSGRSTAVQTGVYKFDTPENVIIIARRLFLGEYGLPMMRLTFFEGMTTREMAMQIDQAFPVFSTKEFLALAQAEEGYLFPDTYFLQPSDTPESIVRKMRSNFDTKIGTLTDAISASGYSLADVVTMASLVEKEGRTNETRRTIAGILWNRVAKSMPLQVDAVFGYINNRPTYSPSYADLKINSPYNTYTHKGLPPGPINNPGLDALDATLHPTKTNYLFYLTDKNGVMHYATTYAGHVLNQKKYLP